VAGCGGRSADGATTDDADGSPTARSRPSTDATSTPARSSTRGGGPTPVAWTNQLGALPWTLGPDRAVGVALGDGPAEGLLGVAVGDLPGTVALSVDDGAERWASPSDGPPWSLSFLDGDLYTLQFDRGARTVATRLAHDGTVRWRTRPDPVRHLSEPRQVGGHLLLAADGGRVYAVTGPGDDEAGPNAQALYALERATGTLVWASFVGGGTYHAVPVGNPAGESGAEVLVTGSTINGLRGYDARDGTPLWGNDAETVSEGDPVPLVDATRPSDRVGSYPGLPAHTDTVVALAGPYRAGEEPPGLVGLDARTGERIWRRPELAPDPGVAVVGDLLVAVGRTADGTGRVYGLDVEDGTRVFEADLGRPVGGRPVLAGGTVYVPTRSAPEDEPPEAWGVAAVDTADKTVRWRTSVPDGDVGGDLAFVRPGDGALLLGVVSAGDTAESVWTTLAAAGPRGRVRWRRKVEDVLSVVAADEAAYYAGGASGTVTRVDLTADGTRTGTDDRDVAAPAPAE
jgi:outer membrane protein assembly factor BamB